MAAGTDTFMGNEGILVACMQDTLCVIMSGMQITFWIQIICCKQRPHHICKLELAARHPSGKLERQLAVWIS